MGTPSTSTLIWGSRRSAKSAYALPASMLGRLVEQRKLAKARVIELIPVGTTITIKTFRDKKGKYGRYIAEIIIEDGKNLNDILLNEGHARLYNKGKI